jgi:hypothetical protein
MRGGRTALGIDAGEPEEIRPSQVACTWFAALGDLYKAKGLQFADGGRDRVTIDPVFHELAIGDRQPAVVVAAMVRKLDADAIKDLMRR